MGMCTDFYDLALDIYMYTVLEHKRFGMGNIV